MQAIWNNKVIAEAGKDSLIYIEGNWYFPPDAINNEYFKTSGKHTTCFWKGEASYYQVDVDGSVNADGAWYYSNPMPSALEKVKKDFTNYVAFWHGAKVIEKSDMGSDSHEELHFTGARQLGR